MNIELLKKKILSEDENQVFESLHYIENNIIDDDVKNLVLKRLNNEKNLFIIIKIIEIVYKKKDVDLIKNIFEILKDNKDKYIKATIVSSLSITENNFGRDYLSESLKDTDSRVRANAVDSIEKKNLKELIPEIINLLKDDNSRVKINVARTLYNYGDRRMLVIFKKFLNGNDLFVSESVIHTLFKIGDEKCLDLLKEFFKNCNKERLVIKLMECFSCINDEEVIPLIRKNTLSNNLKIKRFAEQALKRIKNTKKSKDITCTKCKSTIPNGNKFCGNCGKSV